MTSFILTPGSYGVQPNLLEDEFGIVGYGATVATTTYTAPLTGNSGSSLQVFGSVYSPALGIAMFGSTVLDIGATAIVATPYSNFNTSISVMLLEVDDTIMFNAGALHGGNYGVYVSGIGAEVVQLFNSGLISAVDAGIAAFSNETITLKLTNSGTIRSNGVAILSEYNGDSSVGTSFHITNTGLISGGTEAIRTRGADDILINRGEISGDVLLGGGVDLYNGTDGIVHGTIFGEGGADIFVVGNTIEVIDGGAGLDLLDFQASSGIKVALDGSFANTGDAAGDIYLGIEAISGSTFGKDYLRGDNTGNILAGNGGNDWLEGKAGADVLIGGLGKDGLVGGYGDDVFVFNSLEEGGDKITDFRNIVGNNDSFNFEATGFTGLVAGVLAPTALQIGAANVALSAEVRFIYRTGDTTLWYDSDGSGASGATLLADLQAGATVTIDDFYVI